MLKIKKIRPMANYLVTTMDKYEEDVITASGLIDTNKQKGSIKEYQKVIAVGPFVKYIKEGDLVLINPKRYRQTKHEEGSMKDGVICDNPVISYNIPIVEINDKRYMYLSDNDIEYVVEEYEEDPKPSTIYTPPKNIVI